MKRHFEYGALTASILILAYLGIALLSGIPITIISILLCVAGGAIAGALVAFLFIYFSPEEVIPEGEEDKYIK